MSLFQEEEAKMMMKTFGMGMRLHRSVSHRKLRHKLENEEGSGNWIC